jgi:hypothetical protein
MPDTHRSQTRRDLPDEMPRSAVSGRRLPDPADHQDGIPLLVWLLLAFMVVAAFAAVLLALHPASEHVGGPSADIVVPEAPPPRAP